MGEIRVILGEKSGFSDWKTARDTVTWAGVRCGVYFFIFLEMVETSTVFKTVKNLYFLGKMVERTEI